MAAPSLKLTQLPYFALFLASLIWALYNAALAMVFSFGPALLTEQGWTLATAGTAISAFMIVFSIAVPLGGVLADKTGRRSTIIFVSLASFTVLMPFVPALPAWAIALVFLVVGGLFALGAGPIMTLPSAVLAPEARTFGMGLFFMVYYLVMMIAPRFAGDIADRNADAGLAFVAGSVMCLASIVALLLFHRTAAGKG